MRSRRRALLRRATFSNIPKNVNALFPCIISTVSYHKCPPGFGFTQLRNNQRLLWRKSLFFKDDWPREEGCGVGWGKGQRSFSRPALQKPSTRGSPHADRDSEWQALQLRFPLSAAEPPPGRWPCPLRAQSRWACVVTGSWELCLVVDTPFRRTVQFKQLNWRAYE